MNQEGTQVDSKTPDTQLHEIDIDERTHANGYRPVTGQEPFQPEQLKLMQKSDDEIKTFSTKVQRFYKNQNLMIDSLLEMNALEDIKKDKQETMFQESEKAHELKQRVRRAVNISFTVNFILFILKIMASVDSGSLSIIASALDSMLDLLSGSVMYLLTKAMRKRDPYKYPVSKSRLEPVGIIVFAAIMGMSSLVMAQQALQNLINGLEKTPHRVNISVLTIVVILITIVSKTALYFYCSKIGEESPAVDALASDHRNDICTNLLGIASALLAGFVKKAWFTDPVGALVLSIFIIVNWIRAGKEQIAMLVGKSASPDMISQLVYLAARHDTRILRIDKVLAYHFGIRYICEVDIVLPEDMPLKITHNIGETLEVKIESLPFVERAFVHIDYEWTHSPEHKTF